MKGLLRYGASPLCVVIAGCKVPSTGAQTESNGTFAALNCGFEENTPWGDHKMVAYVHGFGGDNAINLRNAPSSSSPSFGVVPDGTKVIVFSGNSAHWVLVGVSVAQGLQKGYVSTKLLTCDSSSSYARDFAAVALTGGTLSFDGDFTGSSSVRSGQVDWTKSVSCSGSVNKAIGGVNYHYTYQVDMGVDPQNRLQDPAVSVKVGSSTKVGGKVQLSWDGKSNGSVVTATSQGFLGVKDGRMSVSIDYSSSGGTLTHTPNVKGGTTGPTLQAELRCKN